jgi:hypothetical protein
MGISRKKKISLGRLIFFKKGENHACRATLGNKRKPLEPA